MPKNDIPDAPNRQNWATPKWLFDLIYSRYCEFDLDVCAEDWSAKCDRYITKAEDAFSVEWGNSACFCNPPYSDINSWLLRGLGQFRKYEKCEIVYLLPASTDTAWFHSVARKGRVTLLKGRVQFEAPPGMKKKSGNPAGSMIVHFCRDEKLHGVIDTWDPNSSP